VSSKKPETEGHCFGLSTRAARRSIFMFAPPSDLNHVGYGANLRLGVGRSPMSFAFGLMRGTHKREGFTRTQKAIWYFSVPLKQRLGFC
jgi:hypothetical protein